LDSGGAVIYVATGPNLPDDPSWQLRLHRHRQRRPANWEIWEVGADLAPALQRLTVGSLGLVDSLGTWVAAHLEQDSACWVQLRNELIEVIAAGGAPLVVVVEECGWGVVPATAAGGRFRERLGELQQRLAVQAGASWLVVQGRALDLNSLGIALPGEP
jgi:adenosylcobinamide kinase/adenosylcobinamide-phosphate guanylyltransferase